MGTRIQLICKISRVSKCWLIDILQNSCYNSIVQTLSAVFEVAGGANVEVNLSLHFANDATSDNVKCQSDCLISSPGTMLRAVIGPYQQQESAIKPKGWPGDSHLGPRWFSRLYVCDLAEKCVCVCVCCGMSKEKWTSVSVADRRLGVWISPWGPWRQRSVRSTSPINDQPQQAMTTICVSPLKLTWNSICK